MKVIFLLIVAAVLLIKCSEPTEPPIIIPDTTSHEFTWEIDSIGIVGSYFEDIAIINENDVFAVGNLEFDDTGSLDSLGNEIKPYNAARWNGETWSFLRTYPSHGTYHNNKSVFAFDRNDIWVSFSAPYHWNGSTWTPHTTNGAHSGYIWGIWGNSSTDLYITGHTGGITYFDGSLWTAMDSGTDYFLRDIYGKGENVFVVGYNDDGRSVVLELQNGQWQKIFSSNTYYGDLSNNDYGKTTAVTVIGDIAYIISKTGIIKYNYKTKKTALIKAEEALMTGHDYIRICANAENDIMLIGIAGYINHFNGKTWKIYKNFPDIFGYRNIWFFSGHFKDDMVVACGEYDGFAQGVVVRGYRTMK
ncbi:MAG: hypothetical protein GF313_07745 [Caldithrix sp.]|nr:hypothetical protein [Caldithrix sp.]